MIGLERVSCALNHKEGDRCPYYVWVFGQPGVSEEINERFGSFDAFADALDLDLIQAFPAGGPCDPSQYPADQVSHDPTFGRIIPLDVALDVPFGDPHRDAMYNPLRHAVEHDKGRRGRAVFVQTPGVFEAANGWLGLQEHLMALALEPERVAAFYERIADWSVAYIDHCAELGVDCIHVSDDWGMQSGLMFRPEVWEQYIRPATARIADAARRHGLWLSLHSDGDISSLLPQVLELGFHCCHPLQESAGVDITAVKRDYGDRLTMYGGLDIQNTLGRLDREAVAAEIRRVMRTVKPGGGAIFCTSHMVQPGTPIDDVLAAYEVVREESWY